MSIVRAFSDYIQLIIQSHSYDYIKKSKIKDPLFGNLFKKIEAGPPTIFKVGEGGTVSENPEVRGDYSKPIQEIKVFHIDNKGLYTSDIGLETFSGRLYRKFAKTEPEKMQDFVDKYDFCAFPISLLDDLEYVDERYKEIIKKNHIKNFDHPEDLPKGINLEYLLKKHFTFKMLVEKFDDNNINLAGINWLNRQVMANVSPLLLDVYNFPNREIEDEEAEIDSFVEYFEMKKVNISRIVSGYRIFGHFALCCFELLNDIKNQQYATRCQNPSCEKELVNKSHGSEKYCGEKCRKEARTLQKRSERKIKKRQNIKIIKRKTIIKRNL
jgi:hypothetical protein